MTVTNQRLVEILTTAMEKPEIANALIQRVINTLNKQPEPEPVAWFCELPDNKISIKIVGKPTEGNWKPFYTAPPQREWQGLTDDEIKEIVGPWGSLPIDGYTRKLFDQIEAKLKDKNG